MRKFSILSLLGEAAQGNAGWPRQWRDAHPKASYDVIIIGGGGHGLATAYYLAKRHRIRNVAVIEKGWLGGGNTGRNTTVIRSNYAQNASVGLYGRALELWPGLSDELNYNVMFSDRGVLALAHTQHDIQSFKRQMYANRLRGIPGEWLAPEQAKKVCPLLSLDTTMRYPILGAFLQPRGGIARHDAVAWGYARAADNLGVDIIQNCEVTDFSRGTDGAVVGVQTTKGFIGAKSVGVVTAGNTSGLMSKAGLRLPLQSISLQALVSEPVKPVLPCVVMSNTVHAYLSQSDKGELVIGAAMDKCISYSQRGSPQILSEALGAVCEIFPLFSRLRMMRSWAGVVDVTPDRSPIIGKTPIFGLYLNCGWGTGGFKATPASGEAFAWTIATGGPHAINAPFSLERFATGHLIDEGTAASVAH